MSSVGCDRRILRAFYTQYVAVLLIVLTFCISAFQRASTGMVAPSLRVAETPSDVTLTSSVVERAFSEDGTFVADEPRLEAIATILRSHDVSATVTLSVARDSLAGSADAGRQIAAKIDNVENFFLSRNVPRDAVTLKVTTERGDGRSIAVTLVRQEEADDETP